jgi:hypothetical protein
MTAVVDRLRTAGWRTVGEIVDYQGMFLLCYVRGPEGLIMAMPFTAVGVSLDPRVVDLFTVGFVMRTENEQFKTIRACLKGADDLRRNPDRVKPPDIGDLVIELDPPIAGENHIDLLSACVAMSERRTFPRPDAKMRHPRLLSLEIDAGHAGLPSISEAAPRRRVLDIGQIDLLVWA